VSAHPSGAAGYRRTVWLLLRAARRRSVGRARRQRELMQQRKSRGAGVSARLAILGTIAIAAGAHWIFYEDFNAISTIAEYHVAERDGRLLVDDSFLDVAEGLSRDPDLRIKVEAWHRRSAFGGDSAAQEEILRTQIVTRGRDGFVGRGSSGRKRAFGPTDGDRLAFRACAVLVLIWFLMMAFQGEGLELDVQRRRHPMWEWLFSHPIPPGAAFTAEMLTPLAANPIFITAPLFWGLVLRTLHGNRLGAIGGIVVGVAMALAASCFSKTIEILAMVRLSPRSRSAVIGIMSWIGYSSLLLAFVAVSQRGILVALVSGIDDLRAVIPDEPVRWMLGITATGTTSIALALVTCLAISLAIAALSVRLSARATDAGIAGGFADATPTVRTATASRRTGLVRDPLLRKELLWFWRDRGAVVQAFLMPLTMAAMQAFNMRSVAAQAGQTWNALCGLAVLCGTYFLFVLGPRSLTSEGGALWMALTWPRGLEPLLKAKARLWWIISSVIVLAVLGLALARFPEATPQIALVALGWMIFGRSLAEKSVTLVTAPSSWGEPEPVPKGRRWAATLGSFSFASGVMSANWHIAALGVMYSTITSAAMWQNFRERLPCLFDPSSERLPPPPTLMHAMVGISGMVDGMGLVLVASLFVRRWTGRMIEPGAAYGIAGTATFLVMSSFLTARGVRWRQIWEWPEGEGSHGPAFLDRLPRLRSVPVLVAVASALGVALALLAIGYTWVLSQLPFLADQLKEAERYIAANEYDHWWMALAAVGFAPVAEEYLFRGLLFRTLDREWGGWRAIVGSALFFGVYHPPLAWIPVTLVGLVVAILFKATGRLWPCVLLHATYNAVVTLVP